MSTFRNAVLWLALLVLAAVSPCFAQPITGTLTGTVTDATGAVVPNANVTLTNAESGDVRKTNANADGYYSIAAVPAGSYQLTVEAPGFQKHDQKGVVFNGADKRNVDAI